MARKSPGEGERIVSAESAAEDAPAEGSLRPQRLEDFIGQAKVKEQLSIAIAAARKRGEPLDHTVLHGPPARQLSRTSSPPNSASTSRSRQVPPLSDRETWPLS